MTASKKTGPEGSAPQRRAGERPVARKLLLRGSVKFACKHLTQLRELEVSEAQIKRIEAQLPVCEAILHRQAPMKDVRKSLQRLQKSLEHAEKELSTLINVPREQQALIEASILWQRAASDAGADDPSSLGLEQARDAIAKLARISGLAEDSLPKKERRYQAASHEPIGRLYDALLHGWRDEHMTVTDSPPTPADLAAKAERPVAPPFRFTPSDSATSPFRDVIGVCYEALTGVEFDPLRAIRSFIAAEKRKANASAARVAAFLAKRQAVE